VSTAVAPAVVAAVRPAAPAVRARGVVRRYRNGRGAGPIDLDVAPGETVALMGRNGCGKTTLLRMLATAWRPQRGELSWFGGGAAEARHRLGLALDGAVEDAGLTGRQATHFWCAQWVDDRAETVLRTDAALEQLGLAAVADDAVGSYSYGMRRRLALAAALAHDPALALLDEPTAGLDPDGCADLATLLAARTRRGATTIVASNDASFVEAAAGTVVLMEEGRVLRCGSPAELLAALPSGRVAELTVDGGCDVVALRAVAGVSEVVVEGSTVTVRFDGDATIVALVAAADAPGGRLRELRLRRPDLGDCIHQLTGHRPEHPR
jgi:ABC-type multidrug transport system ATPase subunit